MPSLGMLSSSVISAAVLAAGRPAPRPGLPVGYAMRAWTTADGLPQNTVVGMAQDGSGFLWLATPNHLARFDGERFRVFDVARLSDARPDPIRGLGTDRAGRIWAMRTWAGAGVLREDGRIELRTTSAPDGPSAPAIGADGTVWLRRGAQLWRHGPEGWREEVRGELGVLRALFVDASGDVWIGGVRGLARVNAGAIRVWRRADGLPSDTVVAIVRDPRGDVLVLTPAGLAELPSGAAARLVPVHGTSKWAATAIALAAPGRTWVAVRDSVKLVEIRHGPDGTPEAVALAEQAVGTGDARITRLFVDDAARLWVAADGAGLRQLRALDVARVRVADGLPTRPVHIVMGDGSGGLWIAGGCAGLSYWRDGRITTRPVPAAASEGRCVSGLLRDRAGRLWVGLPDQLTRVAPDGTTRSHDLRSGERVPGGAPGAATDVGPLLETPGGDIWFATAAGTVGRVRADGRLEHPLPITGLSSSRIWSMALAADGSVWLGQWGTLSRVAGDSVTRRFGERDGMPAGAIRALLPAADGSWWVASYGGGLGHVAVDGSIATAVPPLLFDRALSALLRDGMGRIWLLADHGLGVVDEAELAAAVKSRHAPSGMIVFGPADSMPEGNGGFPNAWLDEAQRIWLATIDGVATLDASAFSLRRAPVRPHIDAVRVDGVERWIAGDSAVSVVPGRHAIEVDFTAPALDAAGHVRFRYRLAGHDEDWVESGPGRTAQYARVAPGRYVFEVRTQVGAGPEESVRLPVRVEAAWWELAWVRALAAVLLLAAAWRLGRSGAARWRARHEQLQREVRERMRAQEEAARVAAELAHASRLATAGELAASVAHEMNQPLSGILANAQAARHLLHAGDQGELAPALDDIVGQAERAAAVVRSMRSFARKQAPDFRRVALGDVVRETQPLLAHEVRSRGVTLRIEETDAAPPVHADGVQLQQVVVNLVLNAADAVRDLPPERRTVVVAIGGCDGGAELAVRDEGPGLAAEEQARLFEPFYSTKAAGLGLGLSLSRTIVEAHGGSLSVESCPGRGTIVRCRLPAASDR